MILDEDTVKQIFFYCDNKDPNGMYADEVDLLEFANKLEDYLTAQIQKAEHARCVKLVASVNEPVARMLDGLKSY
jgi:hypothetical protein